MVVKDLERVMEFYSSILGIGPWQVTEHDSSGLIVRDKSSPWKAKFAFAQLGPVQLELIQVLSGRSIHSEFLDEGREGLHHLGFFVTQEEKDRTLTVLAQKGIHVIQGSKAGDYRSSYAYLDTQRTGGVLLELLWKAFP